MMQKLTLENYAKKLGCILKYQNEFSQYHIFQSCQPIFEKLGLKEAPNPIHVYETSVEPKKVQFIYLFKLTK